MSTPPDPILLKPGTVAQLLNVGRTKVYELINSGDLPSCRLGGDLRVPYKELMEYVAFQTRWAKRPTKVAEDHGSYLRIVSR